jgi:hypothetical protein
VAQSNLFGAYDIQVYLAQAQQLEIRFNRFKAIMDREPSEYRESCISKQIESARRRAHGWKVRLLMQERIDRLHDRSHIRLGARASNSDSLGRLR